MINDLGRKSPLTELKKKKFQTPTFPGQQFPVNIFITKVPRVMVRTCRYNFF